MRIKPHAARDLRSEPRRQTSATLLLPVRRTLAAATTTPSVTLATRRLAGLLPVGRLFGGLLVLCRPAARHLHGLREPSRGLGARLLADATARAAPSSPATSPGAAATATLGPTTGTRRWLGLGGAAMRGGSTNRDLDLGGGHLFGPARLLGR